ncbi:uncharacterized protein [Neodiprion pinetum]|uniref:uncharacterized protein n=1 Tax=Neodiprion pinetum TaxID=441929 RepID=UPI001EE0DAAF|nr:uncharacterized protein LOC124218560 [Neodiprion pinetum]
MAEPSLDLNIITMDSFQTNQQENRNQEMEFEVFEVDPFARRTSLRRSPPPPKRTTRVENKTREPAPILTPLVLVDLESTRKEAKADAAGPKGAIPKVMSKAGARTMSCPSATSGAAEESERDCLRSLIVLLEGMRDFALAHKNTNVALKEDTAKAAIVVRRVERAWKKMEEELAAAKAPRVAGDKATQTDVATAKRKEISPSAGAAEKRPRPEEKKEGSKEAWSEVVRRGRPKRPAKPATTAPQTSQLPQPSQKAPAVAQPKGQPRGENKRKPVRPDAVLVKVAGGSNYADVLKKIKGGVHPEKTGANITAVKRTRGGDVLLELKGGSGARALSEAVRGVLGGEAKVSTLEPSMVVEVRDLDEVTTEGEVRAALSEALRAPLAELIRLRPGFRGTQTALCKMPERTARKLVALAKIRIGWTVCRIRERVAVDRCHRCQGYGHHAAQCLGPDNSNPCGTEGHKEKECQGSSPRCLTCKNRGLRGDHFSGSGRCSSFKEELQKAKLRQGGRGTRRARVFHRNMPGVRGHATTGPGGGPGVVILQVNLNRSRAAQDLLTQTAAAHGAGILIVSEPSSAGKQGSWLVDRKGDAAIAATNNLPGTLTLEGRGEGFVWARTSGLTIFSCYFSPNVAPVDFEAQLDELESCVRAAGGKTLVSGDFNAKSPSWGSARLNERGQAVAEFLARLDLTPINVGGAPTWQRDSTGSASVIDVTLASPSAVPEVTDWRVLDDESLSDHHYIYMKWRSSSAATHTRHQNSEDTGHRGWDTRKLRRQAMTNYLERQKDHINTGGTDVDTLMATITKVCDEGMPRKRPPRGRTAVHWWTDDIAQRRRECVKARRQAQRTRAKGEDTEASSARYKKAKKALRDNIKASKAKCWEELARLVDEDPWGLPYRLVTRRLGGLRQPNDPEIVERVLEELFPARVEPEWQSQRAPDERRPEPFTVAELVSAAKKLGRGKAPGLDGIPNEALAVVVEHSPDLLLATFNECLTKREFPESWKRQKLVLLPKGPVEEGGLQKYRPISLLDTTGKLMERLIHARLDAALHDAGGLAERQYGFRRGRSTTQAIGEVVRIAREANERKGRFAAPCLLALLDVKNAFNAVGHNTILEALKDKKSIPAYLLDMVASYLGNRLLVYRTSDGQKTRRLTAGVSQGSVLGPLLWNVAYDGLLRMDLPAGVTAVGFADDIALVVTARSAEMLEATTNEAVASVWNWLQARGLDLAERKTEVVVLTRRHTLRINPIKVKGHEVKPANSVKYLGITIDAKINFADHIRRAADKATAVTAAISRLMPNLGGPSAGRRKLLASVAYSTALYAAPICEGALGVKRNEARLEAVARTCALRVITAYRTVSTEVAMVLAGMVPLRLMAEERGRIAARGAEGTGRSGPAGAAIRREERMTTIERWDARWRDGEKGGWTRQAIPTLGPWLDRRHGHLNYHLTQGLTGHGCFGSYLKRIGKEEDARCHHCTAECDDPEHTWFRCPAWEAQRNDMREIVGRVGNICEMARAMLQSHAKWEAAARYITNVLREKEAAERARRQAGETGEPVPGPTVRPVAMLTGGGAAGCVCDIPYAHSVCFLSSGYLHEVGSAISPASGAITTEWARVESLAHEHAAKQVRSGQPRPPATRPTEEGAMVRMTYGDVNYLGNNRAILYLKRRYGGTQQLVNSTSPLKMHPPWRDAVVLDGTVFTASCQCGSLAEHKRMFPHYRTTVETGVTKSNWRVTVEAARTGVAVKRGHHIRTAQSMLVRCGNSEVRGTEGRRSLDRPARSMLRAGWRAGHGGNERPGKQAGHRDKVKECESGATSSWVMSGGGVLAGKNPALSDDIQEQPDVF